MFPQFDSKQKITYRSRDQRNKAAAGLIQRLTKKEAKILNIGSGGEEFLKKALPTRDVFDIDITGKADLVIDLEKVTSFDFADNTFDVVVALDLLEHIENLHAMLEEMLRCSDRFILISLPNPCTYFIRLLKNQTRDITDANQRGVYEKFYGSPNSKPTDRHKWFFSIDDVRALFKHFQEHKKITHIKYFSAHKWNVRRLILRMLCGRRLYYNLFLPNIWILAEVDSQKLDDGGCQEI